MSREEIIKIAHESHIDVYGLGKDYAKFVDALERFFHMAQAAEREKWKPVVEAVVREIPDRDDETSYNAPGHAHQIPGVWNDDNGALAGKECAWCKAWNTAKEVIQARGQA